MNKTVFRFLNILLIVVLSLGALTACGGEEYAEEDTAVESSEGEEELAAEEPAAEAPAAEEPVAEEPAAEEPASAEEAEGDTWLVMLYQDADDGTLERDIFIDLNEAEMIGSSDKVTVVSQFDRYEGEFDGDGDWTSTKRFLVTQGSDLETVESEELEDLGETDMSDPQTLVDFAAWAMTSYPADRYALILSDHGMGWLGGWSDPDPTEGSDMSMSEIDDALAAIVTQTGVGQLDFLGFDACLMSQVESMSAIAPYARYAVASEETEPAVGWAYASFLGSLVENPAMPTAELAQTIVTSYIDQDWRIVDDDARMAFLAENWGVEEDYGAETVAAEMSGDVTLAAIDLSKMEQLNSAINDLALAMSLVDQSSVAAARAYSQSYESVFGKDYEGVYIDLGHFIQLVMDESGDEAVVAAGQVVLDSITETVFAEKHGEGRPGSTGLSIYFPNSDLFPLTVNNEGIQYAVIAGRFAAASLWDDFLTYFYTGEPISPDAFDLSVLQAVTGTAEPQDFSAAAAESAPAADAEIASPGAGEITVSEIALSTDTIAASDTLTISADITGSNVGYVYYYVAYYFEDDGSYVTADMGYINAETSKEAGGMVYPDWGEEETFSVEMDWSPTVFYLSDGTTEGFAYLEPEVYGATVEEDRYITYGLYAPGGDVSKQQEAMIRFNGNLEVESFWVFTGDDETSAPREARFKTGDTFTLWQEWMEYSEEIEDWEYVYYEGDVLTYNGQTFTVAAYDAFAGLYDVGIIVEDYDGNYAESFAELTVTE